MKDNASRQDNSVLFMDDHIETLFHALFVRKKQNKDEEGLLISDRYNNKISL